MIARRGVNTLVLVHRTELLEQWQERLEAVLGVAKGVVGTIGDGKAKPTGKIDIAAMQSLSRHAQIDLSQEAGIQDVFRHLANDVARAAAVAAEVRDAVAQGRKVLVLTERTEHLETIKVELDNLQPAPLDTLVLAMPVVATLG